MTTTKTLKLTFINGQNKKASLTMPDAAGDLTPEQVRQAMDTIAQANVFNRKGVDLYTQTNSAEYIERTVTSVFDDSAAK
ncbi:DUF2922 domain-containing protein [Lactobacillus sp. PV034]|uniref:DUF2922 domain-containing protein n=1 Tax=Lactobacillus sp. PV034 TaxID=2594495 RepID=UPI0022402321|nr:DUF2922 domain-containing protein [Lactobacillus sp. PV034]QNQ81010.1 DUF2922 domain-containing protein [Lactobacillus sp. PV034]